MESLLSLAVVSFLLTALVQFLKKRMPVHALFILAGLSFVCASAYAVLMHYGYWETVVTVGGMLIATANLIFNVFKSIYDALGGDDSGEDA